MRISFYSLFVSVLIFAFILPVQSLQAWGSHGHHGYGHHKYGHRGYQHHYYPYSRSYSSRHSGRKKDCHSTYKYRTDEYGEKTKINGTMCYDDYGKSYIVPGSRYVDNESTGDYEE